MSNVRTDGKGCPIFYRCFSCTFFTIDFTHLPELRQLRTDKAEQLTVSGLTARACDAAQKTRGGPVEYDVAEE